MGEPVHGIRAGGAARSAPRHGAHGSLAALLHQRHDEPAEAGGAHPAELSARASVHDVLAGVAARRCAPEHLQPGLGQARLVALLRAVDRRGDDLRLQLLALRSGRLAGAVADRACDLLLRPADGVADAHQRRSVRRAGQPARGDRGGRAAQPRDHRSGQQALGADAARRLRPDRDHGTDRQYARVGGQAGLDGTPAARHAGGARRPIDQ